MTDHIIKARQFYNERNLPQPYYDLLNAALQQARAEGRREAVREIRAKVTALHPATPVEVYTILDRVASLTSEGSAVQRNARPWLTIGGPVQPHRGNGLPDHIPGTKEGRCPQCGDASESGQPPEASDE